jgi:hypothetical protein
MNLERRDSLSFRGDGRCNGGGEAALARVESRP